MLTYVPVVFDVYRPLKAHLRWTLQKPPSALPIFPGRCFPSLRKLAEVTGYPEEHGGAATCASSSRPGQSRRRRRPGKG